MGIKLSSVLHSNGHPNSESFSVKSINLRTLDPSVSPILVLDQFRVSGRPFGPHPHAGFSAITYVLTDSAGACRSRDTLGNDLVVAPGGICWAQSGSGMMHEETPADPTLELHGIQLFVNLSAKNKLIPPRTLCLQARDVPQWQNDCGDRVRVLVGTFENIASPLVPAEALNLLDVELKTKLSFELPRAHVGVVYVLEGSTKVSADGESQRVGGDEAVAMYAKSGGGRVTLESMQPTQLLVLSATGLNEPIVERGPFVMNDATQIDAAYARYQAGHMGRLAASPRAGGRRNADFP